MIWTLRIVSSKPFNKILNHSLATHFSSLSSVIAYYQVGTVVVADPDRTLTRAAIHMHAQDLGLDVLIANETPPKCKLLLADMEATIIQDEMLDLLAMERGIGDDVATITARAMAGEIDFAQSLAARTKLLAGTTEQQLKSLCTRIRYMPGARELVRTLRASGAKTVLVTGGYDIFANAVAQHCGFDAVVSNRPVMVNGVMTGELELPICTAETKQQELLSHCEALGVGLDFACCLGDGANDILMLETCGFAASYKGKSIVQNIVDLNITTGDLTSVLFAQGFTPCEIIGP